MLDKKLFFNFVPVYD